MWRLLLLPLIAVITQRDTVDLSASLGGAGGFSGLLATCDFAVVYGDTWRQLSRVSNGIKQNAGHTRLYINSLHAVD